MLILAKLLHSKVRSDACWGLTVTHLQAWAAELAKHAHHIDVSLKPSPQLSA